MFTGQPYQAVDASGWYMKTAAVKRTLAVTAPPALMKVAQELFRRSKANLSGPRSNTGKMPVPRVTGTLARSLTLMPIDLFTYAVWSNPKVAHYAKFVHDGTKFMYPRRYIGDAVREYRPMAIQDMQRILLMAIQGVGR
uniref:Tail protein n=1 Tax=viral metagenome TaxID=1070528 RepID=A0A6M3JV48_9ZZZZ